MIFFAPAALLLIIGILVKYKRITWLISGYNTSSREKQAEYDIDKLTRNVGNFLFVLAVIFLLMALASLAFPAYQDLVVYVGFADLAVAIVVGIIFLNTGNRVKKDK